MIAKVISGGQTGGDRGALDAALELGVAHGGWCPRKRRAEDGRVPSCYELTEHVLYGYRHRTRANVEGSDATVIFIFGPEGPQRKPSGSKTTERLARRLKRPVCVIDLEQLGIDGAASIITRWLDDCDALGHPIQTLNVAGRRESKAPGIQRAVREVMLRVLRTHGERETAPQESPSRAFDLL